MLVDYHTHTFRCGHAVGTFDEYVDAAIARGLDEIGLSDHLYLYYEEPARRTREWAIPEDEYNLHYREMAEVPERYRGRINVRVSVEADYVHGKEAELKQILARYQFDYILGSVHYMDGWLIDAPENEHRYREERVAEIYRRYFRNVAKAAGSGIFHLLGHIDLPKKFGYVPEESVEHELQAMLDTIAHHDVAVEISTAGLRKPAREMYPSPTIIRQMQRRGIPVALSSDAHDPADVGADYDLAQTLLEWAGYKTIVRFAGGQREEVPIG